MKRYILLLMAVCCLFSISAQQSTKEIPVEPLCLVAPDSAQKTKQLVILQTSDTHSRIEPISVNAADRYAGMGGTVRRATFIKEARKINPNLLLFDCGDISQGTPYYNLFQGEVEVKMMNLMGYDAMTIGNHEFDFGLENMARLFRMANFPVVCSNYDVTGTVLEGLVKPYTTFNRNGLKIGVFGLAPKMEGLVQPDKSEGQDNKERIMYIGSGCSEAWFRNAPQSLSGQGAASVLRSLVDEYETADGVALKNLPAAEREKLEKNPLEVARDPRLYATVVMPGDNTSFLNYVYEPFKDGGADQVGKVGASRTGYWAKKFLDEQDRASGSGSLYFPLYRYAEVLLSYVECLVETGDWQNPDVEKYINMIRNRAGMPNMNKAVYNTQEKVRELYRRERRVELAFEGKRYFDIRRWGIGNETMNGAALGAWNPTTNTYVQVENRACTFPKYNAWPIPQAEETANPNIDQPTGW